MHPLSFAAGITTLFPLDRRFTSNLQRREQEPRSRMYSVSVAVVTKAP